MQTQATAPTLLEYGGRIELWAGWNITVPASYHQQNVDRSWSSWGANWTVDVHIIEVAGDDEGRPVSAEKILGLDKKINAIGIGWIGLIEKRREIENEREIFRLTASLAAKNTLMSCWVSYFTEEQFSTAEDMITKVVHNPLSAT
jgi:hypothetical protein